MPMDFPGSVHVSVQVPSITMGLPTSTLRVLPTPGPQGPAGAPGTPGGVAFEYTQASPASTWIIDHNLGRKVHVSVFSDDAVVVFADVVHGSPDQTTISYPTPTTGSAVIS